MSKMERQNSALNGRLFSLLKKMETTTETNTGNVVPIAEKILDKNSMPGINEPAKIKKVNRNTLLRKVTKNGYMNRK